MNETSQPNSITLPVARQWQACPNNPPGKIQVNRVNQALRDLRNEHFTSIEKRGIIGKTDGYDAESEFSTVRYSIGGENTERADVRAEQDRIGEKYGYAVSRENAKDIVAEIEAAIVILAVARPVNDERETQEQADARKVQQTQDNQKRQAEDEARAAALRLTMETAFGIPGRTVHLSAGEMAVVAVLCYDNSHYQSDYFDGHARLGVPLLVGTSRSSREDEATARRAMERFPMLAALNWEWKTEKYSMGHGNYLTSEGVDVPAELAATRTRYGGGDITRGHWEIQFERGGRAEKEAFSLFAGYYDRPDPQTSAEADAAADSRSGSTGTVRRNLEHDGVEVAFSSKPAREVIDRLKANGFRWSPRSHVWYKRFSDGAWAAACLIAGVSPQGNAPHSDESRQEFIDAARKAFSNGDDGAAAYVQAQEDAFQDRAAEVCGV